MRLTALISMLVAGSVSLLTSHPLEPQDRPTFKSSSELVVMHVSVRDRVSAFNEAVRHAWGPRVIADTDPAQFASAMQEAITARGMTAIYDGIVGGLSRLEHAKHTRQVLILVSDGERLHNRLHSDEEW